MHRRGGRRRAVGDDVRDRPAVRDRRRRRALEGRRRRAGRGRHGGHGPRDADRRLLRPRGGPRQGARGAAQGGRGGRRRGRRRERAEAARAAALAGQAGGGARASSSTTRRASALVAQVGERQQRLLRELEKLALEYGAGRARSASRRSQASSCASSAERKVWTLADALVAGDEKAATRALLELRQQGERLPGLLYQMVRRVRDALAIAEALAAGQPAAQVKQGLRMPSFAADRLIADVSQPRRRGLPARARAAGRPRGREPRRRRRRAQRGHRGGAGGARGGALGDELRRER